MIDVYVFLRGEAVDRNGMLAPDQSLAISPELRRELGDYMNLGRAKQVTRLEYRGALSALRKDAFFEVAETSTATAP